MVNFVKNARFFLLLTGALLLTACDKPTQQPAPVQAHPNAVSAPVTDPHTGHDMSHTATASDAQPPHIMAYMNLMTTMHGDMNTGAKAKNADMGFAQGMIPHHQGAIDMAKIEQQYGKDHDLKALAQHIIDTQQAEITLMQNWLATNEAKQAVASNAESIAKAYQASNQANHDAMMQGVMDINPDIAFVKGMIPHHQGAIDMANVEIKYGKNPDMLKLAQQIKAAQTPEIQQMQAWLAKMGQK